MNDRDRLKQIRALRDRLERLPESPQRDQILRDVRRRAVDIESGMKPAPMSTAEVVSPPPPPRVTLAAPPVPVPVPVRPRPKTPVKRVVEPAPFVAGPMQVGPPDASLLEGIVLCLGDEDVATTEPPARRAAAPWARGLRG